MSHYVHLGPSMESFFFREYIAIPAICLELWEIPISTEREKDENSESNFLPIFHESFTLKASQDGSYGFGPKV